MTQNFDFIRNEENILKFWTENKIFEKSDELAKDRPEYVFFDGPPFATGLPHYGHILASTIKDSIGRFFYQHGYSIERKFGWDCHGLPVEYEIDKRENINSREEIIAMGIDKYNEMCRSIVDIYTNEWKHVINRLGRWVSFDNGYKTMDTTFMETVWHIFSLLYEKGCVYRGYRVMPFSTACSTPLSNFEANQNYKEVSDPSIVFKIKLNEKINKMEVCLLVWTTTPWTLPSNCALAINKEFVYVIVESDGLFYCVLKERVNDFFSICADTNKNVDNITKKFDNLKVDTKKQKAKIVCDISGKELVNKTYHPIFDYFIHLQAKNFFRILEGDFIDKESGTGIVHCAPGFGEEDYNCFVKNKLIKENDKVPCPVNDKGLYTDEIKEFAGRYVKDCDKEIIKILKNKKMLFSSSSIVHRYPFCWRSDTPLLYKVVPNWFIRVKDSVEEMLKNNEKINWIPESVKYKKFHNWLENARDWSISRNRFWGTPIPIWTDKTYTKFICVKNIQDLENQSGTKIFYNRSTTNKNDENDKYKQTDIHREYIDHIVIVKDGIEYKRIDEVLDCWFESGSMPYAQHHYPFSNKKLAVPGDFIGEGVDQTRGWFYTLHVISTILFNQPAFKNVIVNGIVLAEDGRKMSKRLKNYPDVMEVIQKYGSDCLRLCLLSSPVTVGENLRFSEGRVKDVFKMVLIPWYNVFKFYMESKEGESNLTMDSWIINRFNSLHAIIDKEVKSYRLNNLLPNILEFVDDLSNWYIRMNREDIRNGNTSTLKYLLHNFSIIMAPFTPFFSEYCYQQINKCQNESSVHFLIFPELQKTTTHTFDKIKQILVGVRSIRESVKISLKTPLRNCKIICKPEFMNNIKEFESVIKKECNLLNFEFLKEEDFEFAESWKPNFMNISTNKKEKIAIINKLNKNEIKVLRENNEIEKDGIKIKFDEVLYKKELINFEGEYKTFQSFTLILDTKIDDEIIEMRNAREFYGCVQKMRKNCGFKVEDKVYVYIEDTTIQSNVLKYYSIDFATQKPDEYVASETISIDNKNVDILLIK
ncbi:hypothetical protein BDAP_000172 [Binucleata daphniae]